MILNGNHRKTTGTTQPHNVHPADSGCGQPDCSARFLARQNQIRHMMPAGTVVIDAQPDRRDSTIAAALPSALIIRKIALATPSPPRLRRVVCG